MRIQSMFIRNLHCKLNRGFGVLGFWGFGDTSASSPTQPPAASPPASPCSATSTSLNPAPSSASPAPGHRADHPPKLPEGFQRSEFLLEHGFLDAVVTRGDLKSYLVRALDFLKPRLTPCSSDLRSLAPPSGKN